MGLNHYGSAPELQCAARILLARAPESMGIDPAPARRSPCAEVGQYHVNDTCGAAAAWPVGSCYRSPTGDAGWARDVTPTSRCPASASSPGPGGVLAPVGSNECNKTVKMR